MNQEIVLTGSSSCLNSTFGECFDFMKLYWLLFTTVSLYTHSLIQGKHHVLHFNSGLYDCLFNFMIATKKKFIGYMRVKMFWCNCPCVRNTVYDPHCPRRSHASSSLYGSQTWTQFTDQRVCETFLIQCHPNYQLLPLFFFFFAFTLLCTLVYSCRESTEF